MENDFHNEDAYNWQAWWRLTRSEAERTESLTSKLGDVARPRRSEKKFTRHLFCEY